ncbi:MAG TPA: helix-turn-helix domain-containing protein [Solirubrobacteraceae bacterium]
MRGRRRDLGMSQADLAARAGVSRKWIYEFEAGRPKAGLGLILRVMDTLGIQLELSLDEQARTTVVGHAVDLDALINEHRDR